MGFLKKNKFIISLVAVSIIFILGAKCAQAQILPACTTTGDCSLCDLVNVAINIGKFILAITGSLLLFFFIYGGFWMLISGGDSNKVKKGKDIIINSLIGLVIIFSAYLIVAFIMVVLSGGTITDPAAWAESKLVCPCKTSADCPKSKPNCNIQSGETRGRCE